MFIGKILGVEEDKYIRIINFSCRNDKMVIVVKIGVVTFIFLYIRVYE